MSNPTVIVSNSIPEPSDISTTRKSYTLRSFDSLDFFLYRRGETSSTFDPSDMGQEFYVFSMVADALTGLGTLPPKFITAGAWDGVGASPSGFITPNNSIMPKVLTPSTLMVDNGIVSPYNMEKAYWWDDLNVPRELFNWTIDRFNDAAITSVRKYARSAGMIGEHYVSVNCKSDTDAESKLEMYLTNPSVPPSDDWDDTSLVGGGAFTLLLNIVSTTAGQVQPQGSSGTEGNRWGITIRFGEVTMTLEDSSTMKVMIGEDGEETTVNLAEGAAKEGIPQLHHISDGKPLVIGVYPCWNGILVVSGQQETKQVKYTAITFCPKLKNVSIMKSPYSDWFDPKNPSNVEVGVGSGATNVLVDFGTRIDVEARNCRFEIAYLPRFFTKQVSLDGWFLLSTSNQDSSFSYKVYTIYTNNGTDFDFDPSPSITESSYSGSVDDTAYHYVGWKYKSEAELYRRFAGEIFGYVLETTERRRYSLKNGNGNFDLEWSGGTPGDSTAGGDWKKFVKSVQVTIGLDGSSGSITVDKYGVAGQDAVPRQRIGAIVLEATGGDNTVAGEIFSGLAMGITDNNSSGDAMWTIPLIGLEKKMDDIALINPPFMDGETLATAVDYLCRYAGIRYDLSFADPNVRLSASEQINVARFDWKSGTSVKTALDAVMMDINHSYVVRDGLVYFYRLGDYGLPVFLGPDRSVGYNNTNIVSVDKTPDFEDLRNYVVAIALQQVPDGRGTKTNDVPTFPMIDARTKNTTPDVPWARCLVQVFPGTLDSDTLSELANRLSRMTHKYELTGNLTIPGNASIKPYDQWGDNVVYSITHTINMDTKEWTTSLEFMRTGD